MIFSKAHYLLGKMKFYSEERNDGWLEIKVHVDLPKSANFSVHSGSRSLWCGVLVGRVFPRPPGSHVLYKWSRSPPRLPVFLGTGIYSQERLHIYMTVSPSLSCGSQGSQEVPWKSWFLGAGLEVQWHLDSP